MKQSSSSSLGFLFIAWVLTLVLGGLSLHLVSVEAEERLKRAPEERRVIYPGESDGRSGIEVPRSFQFSRLKA